MKKIIYSSLAVIGLVAFASCSKDFTCSCEIERITTDGDITRYNRDYTIKDSKRSWAKDRCVSTEWSEDEYVDDSMGFPITYPGYTETVMCDLN